LENKWAETLKANEFASEAEKERLKQLFSIQPENSLEKIAVVKEIFKSTGAAQATQEAIQEYTFKAFETLEIMDIAQDKKDLLRVFGENLMGRKV
jgi:geranylgeranyl diphosphate synthase type II